MRPTQLKRRNPATGKNECWNPNTLRFEEEENPFPYFPGYSPNFPVYPFPNLISSTNENDVQIANKKFNAFVEISKTNSLKELGVEKIRANKEIELANRQVEISKHSFICDAVKTKILADPHRNGYRAAIRKRGLFGMYVDVDVIVEAYD